jgi:CBS domain-containing protein
MRRVSHLLQTKGRDVWSIEPSATVSQALTMLADKGIGALVVMEQDDLLGIFSERDYARRVELEGRASHETSVRDVMTERVVTIKPDDSIDACMALMTSGRFRHLPVLEAGKVVGVISIGDVVKEVIAEHEFTIEQLENYISGDR